MFVSFLCLCGDTIRLPVRSQTLLVWKYSLLRSSSISGLWTDSDNSCRHKLSHATSLSAKSLTAWRVSSMSAKITSALDAVRDNQPFIVIARHRCADSCFLTLTRIR
jgi:hypothetical protein